MLAERGDNPALAASTAEALQTELHAGDSSRLRTVMTALARPTRIVRGKPIGASVRVDPSKFEGPQEQKLHATYQEVAQKLQGIGSGVAVGAWLEALLPLAEPVDAFFDSVFVMCEDEGVRANRLALLRDVAALSSGVLDLAQLPGF